MISAVMLYNDYKQELFKIIEVVLINRFRRSRSDKLVVDVTTVGVLFGRDCTVLSYNNKTIVMKLFLQHIRGLSVLISYRSLLAAATSDRSVTAGFVGTGREVQAGIPVKEPRGHQMKASANARLYWEILQAHRMV